MHTRRSGSVSLTKIKGASYSQKKIKGPSGPKGRSGTESWAEDRAPFSVIGPQIQTCWAVNFRRGMEFDTAHGLCRRRRRRGLVTGEVAVTDLPWHRGTGEVAGGRSKATWPACCCPPTHSASTGWNPAGGRAREATEGSQPGSTPIPSLPPPPPPPL